MISDLSDIFAVISDLSSTNSRFKIQNSIDSNLAKSFRINSSQLEILEWKYKLPPPPPQFTAERKETQNWPKFQPILILLTFLSDKTPDFLETHIKIITDFSRFSSPIKYEAIMKYNAIGDFFWLKGT